MHTNRDQHGTQNKRKRKYLIPVFISAIITICSYPVQAAETQHVVLNETNIQKRIEKLLPNTKQETSEQLELSYDSSSSISVDGLVYKKLRTELGLNHAAACGVLANMQLESSLNPNAVGDSGTSYGLCQWHYGRYSSLINYCSANGLDYKTAGGQVEYLLNELRGNYSSVLSMLLSVPDTQDGAYKAAHEFCVYFEAPDKTLERANERGNVARYDWFPRMIQSAAGIVKQVRQDLSNTLSRNNEEQAIKKDENGSSKDGKEIVLQIRSSLIKS